VNSNTGHSPDNCRKGAIILTFELSKNVSAESMELDDVDRKPLVRKLLKHEENLRAPFLRYSVKQRVDVVSSFVVLHVVLTAVMNVLW
jgi:hypothetical protein